MKNGEWWQFYCWLCADWLTHREPQCDDWIAKQMQHTEQCYFREYPERANGVRWPSDMPPHQGSASSS
jgi:hypothetical protein